MFDGFNNLTARLVQENDIAVLAHDFDDQSHSHAIADFVLIGDADFQNPIILHLLDCFNDGSLQVFAHDHDKGIGNSWIFKRGICQLDAPKDRVG